MRNKRRVRKKESPRDRPTCKQCKECYTCIESSRMYPCTDFKRRGMTDKELAETMSMCVAVFMSMAVVYVLWI